MRDIVHNIKTLQAIVPAVLAASANGAAIDLKGVGSVAFIINSGAIAGAGDFTVKLQESDTTTDADFADVPASLLLGALPASLAADSVAKIGYRGFKRYVRLAVTKNGGTSIAAGAVAVMGYVQDRPVA
ncbi:hypothetical protein GHK50_29865 [Sinorhizobium medicae]|uniref:Uncharacterized protein n=1 Tax=Sinorhizobium medicae TaxID=110321 RepID=A0A6G1WDP5_9HYPH|nr:hypothetical protein [Sinorhizobium medicae]MDX0622448.1 hypothetical protein [Sinorhizobium medicae]MQW67860.1 hypothetical protein [Sinorhizobium medicae]MQX87085.1 hypothetical protein [Sinorhizobium medicae]